MIGRPRVALVATAVGGYAAVHVVLAVVHAGRATDPVPYYLALALALLACGAVLWAPPPDLRLPYVAAVVAAVAASALLVLSVLPVGKASWAMWYATLAVAPLGGVALRGHPRLAVSAAVVVAGLTTAWTTVHAEGLAEGLYRTVTPTAGVAVCAGVAVLMRSSREGVARAHADQLAAGALAARLRARERERTDRIADVGRLATPVLRALVAGGPADSRLTRACALLEARLRDGIRGRDLADPAVATAAWSARARGVRVTLLDDGGALAAADSPGLGVLRATVARALDQLSDGSLTARVVPSVDPADGPRRIGTVVIQSPQAAVAVAALDRPPGVDIEVEADEAVIVVTAEDEPDPGRAGA